MKASTVKFDNQKSNSNRRKKSGQKKRKGWGGGCVWQTDPE